jgi:hypothetical protein
MGYETTLHLVGVRIAPTHRPRIEKLLKKQRAAKDPALACLFQLVDLTSLHTLEFRRKKLPMPEESELPDEEGFVLSAVGKWYGSEKFACWLCRNGFEGSVVQHSREGDGAAWGWEFRGGRIRYLELKAVGTWKRLRPVSP